MTSTPLFRITRTKPHNRWPSPNDKWGCEVPWGWGNVDCAAVDYGGPASLEPSPRPRAKCAAEIQTRSHNPIIDMTNFNSQLPPAGSSPYTAEVIRSPEFYPQTRRLRPLNSITPVVSTSFHLPPKALLPSKGISGPS